MNTCSELHQEIVHTERHCPLCAVITESEQLVKEIEELEATVLKLQTELDDAMGQAMQ